MIMRNTILCARLQLSCQLINSQKITAFLLCSRNMLQGFATSPLLDSVALPLNQQLGMHDYTSSTLRLIIWKVSLPIKIKTNI